MLGPKFWRRLAALAWLCATAAQALQVTDDRGITLNFAQPPQRIVSLLPSLAETVCELGHCGRLVGVDRYTNYPASLQKLVHDLLMKRLLDGQFEECGLTLTELHRIEESLSKSLTALFHARIKYPDDHHLKAA